MPRWQFAGDQDYVPNEGYQLLVDARRQLLETLADGNAALQGARIRSIARQEQWQAQRRRADQDALAMPPPLQRAYDETIARQALVDAGSSRRPDVPRKLRVLAGDTSSPYPREVLSIDDDTGEGDYDAERPLIEQLLELASGNDDDDDDDAAVIAAPTSFRAERRRMLLAAIDRRLDEYKAAQPAAAAAADTRELERRVRSEEALARLPLTEDELRAIFFRALDITVADLQQQPHDVSEAEAYFYGNVVNRLPVKAMAEQWFDEWKNERGGVVPENIVQRLKAQVRGLVFDWRGQVFASVERRSASLHERGNVRAFIERAAAATDESWPVELRRFSLLSYVQLVEWRLASLEARLAETDAKRAVPRIIERHEVDRSPLLFPVRASYSGGDAPPAATFFLERFDREHSTTERVGEMLAQQPSPVWPVPDARGGLYRLVVVETATADRFRSSWVDVRRMTECVRCAVRFDVDTKRVFSECRWREHPVNDKRARFMRTMLLSPHLETLRTTLPYGEPFDVTRPLPSRQEAARRYCTLDGLLERNYLGASAAELRTAPLFPLLTAIADGADVLASDRLFARTLYARLSLFVAVDATLRGGVNWSLVDRHRVGGSDADPFAAPLTREAIDRSDVWHAARDGGSLLPYARDEMLFDDVAAATYDRLRALAPSEAEFIGVHSSNDTQPDVEQRGGANIQGSIRARMPVDFAALHREAQTKDWALYAYNALVQFGPALEFPAAPTAKTELKRFDVAAVEAWWKP